MIVIDPGHGGDREVAGSTPFGVRGRYLVEKELVLDVALRIRARAPDTFVLTRDRDHNLSRADRLELARDAEGLISLHAGGALAGPETWIRPHSTADGLARRVHSALGGELLHGNLGMLAHAPSEACLVELCRFGGVEEVALRDDGERDRVATAIARAALDAFDIWHEVPLVEQLTGMSCWAAAAAMIVGWRDRLHIDAVSVARGAGRQSAYRDGLEPRDVATFARAWGLEVARLAELSVREVRALLAHGPLWVGEASPGLHVIVVAGMFGDGSVDNTFVRIADPWPIGRGERYTLSFREFRENLINAAMIAGDTQVLHAPRGARPS
ncbi:MAG: papain-like cysteine protease family protein [Kofleriaceae bacterium]